MKYLFVFCTLLITFFSAEAQRCKDLTKGYYVLQSELALCSSSEQKTKGLNTVASVTIGKTIPGLCTAGKNYVFQKVNTEEFKTSYISVIYKANGKNCTLTVIDNKTETCYITTAKRVFNGKR